jgi:Ribbon-helix-helix protein, copG family
MGRPKSDKQATRLTVTLDAEDYAKICTLANQNDVSAAWVIRRAIESYLDHPQQATPVPAVALSRGGGHI